MEWINAGFNRNEEGDCWLIWECSDCGFQGLGGINPPKVNCPECGKKPNIKIYNEEKNK